MKLAVFVLLAGCLTSSQAHISLNGTAFEYEAPDAFWVSSVGELRDWQAVTFAAEPGIESRNADGVTMIGAEPAAIASGPIEIGQAFRFCATSSEDVELTMQAGRGTTTVTLRMGAC